MAPGPHEERSARKLIVGRQVGKTMLLCSLEIKLESKPRFSLEMSFMTQARVKEHTRDNYDCRHQCSDSKHGKRTKHRNLKLCKKIYDSEKNNGHSPQNSCPFHIFA